jgi:hypothetical protein
MGKLRLVAVPAAFALALVGYASAPGTRASDSPPARVEPGPGAAEVIKRQPRSGVLQPVKRPAGDFNGDGFSDLAVGVPTEDVTGTVDGGGVNVIYGSATGLVAAANQLWHQNTPGIADKAESFDEYGAFGLCAGDYNGDGAADLAVNVPEEDVGSVVDAGAVNVIYGSAAGLTDAGNQLWTQNSPGILDTVEEGDLFGAGLASGVH